MPGIESSNTGIGSNFSSAPWGGFGDLGTKALGYGVGAGNIGNVSVMSGSEVGAPYGLGVGAGTGGATQLGLGGAGEAATAASSGSWAPYAMAGGSILSTLFQGLLQMEQQREKNIQDIKMAQARANIEREQAKSSALDRLIQVWRR